MAKPKIILNTPQKAEAKEKKKARNSRYYLKKKQKQNEELENKNPEEVNEIKLKKEQKKNFRNQEARDNYHQHTKQHKKEYYNNKKTQDDANLEQMFFDSINQQCDKLCAICKRIFYNDQVQLNYTLSPRHIQLITSMYGNEFEVHNKIIACFTCLNHLRSNKLPNIMYLNQLYPGDIPNELQILTDVEISLISNNSY